MCCRGKSCKQQRINLSCINSSRKVIIVGESGVGKSSLLFRYVKNLFEESHNTTIGGSFVQLEVDIGAERVILDVWDTAGQEKYRSLMSLYFRHASLAIVVYDISKKITLEKCTEWVKIVQEVEPKVRLFLVGTKEDCIREVEIEEAQEYAKRHNMKLVETSAKSGKNIELLFKLIATAVSKASVL